MQRLVVAHLLYGTAAFAHTFDELVLRTVEHPHVKPGLEEQRRRLNGTAHVGFEHRTG